MEKNIQKRVLNIIFKFNKSDLTIKELSKQAEIEDFQTYNAVQHLFNRDLISKKLECSEQGGYCKPPKKKLIVFINPRMEKRVRKILNVKEEDTEN